MMHYSTWEGKGFDDFHGLHDLTRKQVRGVRHDSDRTGCLRMVCMGFTA